MDRAAFRRLGENLLWAIAIATVLGFVAYAAAVSIKAALNLEDVDPVKIGTEAFFTTGAMGVIGAFALSALQAS